ncbi:MAG: hypothetical protein A2687_01540 [Candidatus Levybacteria bacterium RIFCSPHIGHO2_01_FULL_38_26]|nr:MAG: hypothetical protein A2687_01540 [Candidatus Levybacteria bacterium RIFCSPHIGHO2_01_FULL_38_26]
MTKKAEYIFLLFIVCAASILRLWNLGVVPPSPDWDEVALGYNAYSIMQTGKDEYGEFLPVILRSFDDYKPALYAYFTIPFIALFDLTVFAVRLPSAIFGILTVVATYFLVKELFINPKSEIRNPKQIKNSNNQNSKNSLEIRNLKFEIPIVAAALLAISPWHIQFSRVAFESNMGLAFNVFGLLFFLKGLKKPFFILFSVLLFSLNLYVYQSEKVFVPLIVVCLIVIYKKKLLSLSKKYIAMGVLLGIFVVMPMLIFSATGKNTLSRLEGVSFLSNSTELLKDTIEKNIRNTNNNDIIGLLFDNRRLVYTKTFISGYISHFDFNWLFLKGDFQNNRHHAPNMGLLYFFELPFLLIGIYILVFDKMFDRKTKLLLFSWFFIAPIPASISGDVPHAVRTLNFLPTFQVFTAIGIIFAFQKIFSIQYSVFSFKHSRFLIVIFMFSFFTFNFIYYLNQYFVQQNYFYSYDWQYGYKELVEFLKPIQKNYEKVIVSNRGSLSQSHMFFLFYLKYDPSKYLSEGGSFSKEIPEKKTFSNFEFREFNYYSEHGKVLFVGTDQDFPNDFKEVKRIYNLDGSLAIRVVEKEL